MKLKDTTLCWWSPLRACKRMHDRHHWNLGRAALKVQSYKCVTAVCYFKSIQSLLTLCVCIDDATKCRFMSNELMYWHTLIVHYGTRARFLNNNISRFESAFRCNCCHRCGSLSYSTMKSIDTSYTMKPCLSKLSKFLTKQYINILWRIMVSDNFFMKTIL